MRIIGAKILIKSEALPDLEFADLKEDTDMCQAHYNQASITEQNTAKENPKQ